MNPMDVLLTVIRLLVGLLFVGHGARKLFGWFGGKGWKGTAQAMSELGFRPAKFWALLAGLFDFLGGVSLTLGLLTPIGAAAIIGVRLASILSLHAPKGLWNADGGVEYPLIVIANGLWFGLLGAGVYSLDYMLKFAWEPATLFLISGAVILIGVVLALLTTVQLPSHKHLPVS
jgi:putative oxidoreductase